MNPAFKATLKTLREYNIEVTITRKKVKNINFRIKPYQLNVSAPWYASDVEVAYALHQRLDWAITVHQKLLNKQKDNLNYYPKPDQISPLRLWGKVHHDIQLNEIQRLKIYRQELANVMPKLFVKWQPIVGKTTHEQRIKKMKTRWGSCNTKAKRVWLSVYLPEHPIECTEYVIVHELCHLHQANHSPKFWGEVAKAMPDYKHWHDMLAGKFVSKSCEYE
ncbi:MAG: zinc metalloprotease [Gammaproteobacteria bacterium]|nr:MAG: zinc metalloprotease [Gammaproteobacteria bacterium]